MHIAIHAADLDHERIDGPRVYLFNMLKNLGKFDQRDSFLIYHRNKFNPELVPPHFSNYEIKSAEAPFLWTQTSFALKIFRDDPDVLWMPIQNIPLLRRKKMRTVVTIHDLAFKIFPQHFTGEDLFKLNKLADMAIRGADHIIAISKCTKKDILRFYPDVPEKNISVVHNGFDGELFSKKTSAEDFGRISRKYGLEAKSYLLYVGAIQPRKNLEVLVEAFGKIKKDYPELKLVIAGAPAWKHESVFKKISESPHKKDIVVTGRLSFGDVPVFYQNSLMSIYPSLYEGFGIPILEAMASGVPVISARNSSLPEVGGDAALFFKTESSEDLADCIRRITENEKLRNEFIRKGTLRAENFSWEKCAKETLDILLKK